MKNSKYIKELTDYLVELRAITPQENDSLEHDFARSDQERFDDFLLESGLVDKDDLLKALSMLYQVPYMDVNGYFFDTFLLRKFPKGFLTEYAVIPYKQDENMLLMVAADPSDSRLLPLIGDHVSYDIRFNVGIYTDIIDMIDMYYEKSLTEAVDEDKALQAQFLDDLPVAQEDRDQQELIDEKIDDEVSK